MLEILSTRLPPHVWQLVLGLTSLVRPLGKGTGGSNSAEYCYSVWLRHLVGVGASGLSTNPRVVVEIGPGDSLGVGLAALMSGAEKYLAFDVVDHASQEVNREVFQRLVGLFTSRTPIPHAILDADDIEPRLGAYEFPFHILGDERISAATMPDRLKEIEVALAELGSRNARSCIQYITPGSASLDAASSVRADLILSQAAMEHVDDLEGVYRSCFEWLVPGGGMSHQIDFRCHDTAPEWNGHWKYSSVKWQMIRGRRKWLLNRCPLSTHLEIMKAIGFQILHVQRQHGQAGIERRQLARDFSCLSDRDLATAGAYVVARKPGVS